MDLGPQARGTVYTRAADGYDRVMRYARVAMIAGLLSLAAASAASAAIPPNPGPPRQPAKSIIYGSYISVGVLLLAVLSAAFKPAKRTHQD